MKKLKAQQITEFMLAVPILIAFFAILTEFAFALNSQLVLSNALKSSIAAYPYKISQIDREFSYPSDDEIKAYIEEELKKMKLEQNRLSITLLSVNQTPVVLANYEHKTGFTFSFLPALKSINMSAIAVFPYTHRNISGYDNGINPATSGINQADNRAYQPPCHPCYITKCAWYETNPIYDDVGNIVDYYTYCAAHCSESQGDWWCIRDKNKTCPGTSTQEHFSC